MPPSKQLFVLRHAKSSWDDRWLDDHERPLARRGKEAVKVLAEHVRASGINPAQILCSSSRRTRETLDGLGPPGERLIERELYFASAESVLERLHLVPEEIDSVMVIGHNPAMQVLVLRLAGSDDTSNHTRNNDENDNNLVRVQRKFPTGALATLTFYCAWAELDTGRARLVDFVRPKGLRAL